jgi:hypothetical protein
VANGKTVTGTGLSLAGADAGNYTVNTTATTTANITPAPLTIQADNASKVYGTTFTPASTAFTVPVPPIPGETVASVTETSPAGTPATAAVPGPYAITPSAAAANGAFLPSNYNITYVDGALTVTAAPLTVTALDVTKVFGETPTLSLFTTAGLVNSETVASVTETSPGTVATAAVPGPYAITPSAATGGSFTPTNYAITYVDGALLVTPAPVPPIIVPPVVVVPPVAPPVVVVPPVIVVPPVVVVPPIVPPVDVVPPIVVVPPVTPPDVTTPGVTPPVELAAAPAEEAPEVPQLELAPALPVQDRLNLVVVGTGVRMPPVLVAATPPLIVPPVAPPVPPAPLVVPPEAPPPVYVPPVRPRKPDRG